MGRENFIPVAQIDSTHGLRGEVSAALRTDFPGRFEALESVHVGRRDDTSHGSRLRLERWRLHRGKVLLKFEGVDDLDSALALVGCDLWIDREHALALPEGTYYHQDLIGLSVRDREGRALGTVQDILITGGTDVLVVRSDGTELLIPAARSICVQVDVAGGTLVVDPPEGLLEINAV